MIKHRISTWITVIIWLGLASGPAQTERPQKERPTQPFMRQKLTYSQGILEGLVLEKYDLVSSNATLLRNMNMTNAFLALRNPYYMEHITNFQARVDELISVASEKRLDGATEAYSRVIGSCVACHDQFRKQQFTAHAFGSQEASKP